MKTPEEGKLYPISTAQKTLRWSEIFTIERRAVSENNVITAYMRVRRDCYIKALEQAFNELVKRNDALRLHFYRTLGGIKQSIQDFKYTQLERIDVRGRQGFNEYIGSIYSNRVCLFGQNIWWAKIIICGRGDCALVMRIHHAAVDGYSVRLLFERLEKYYDSFRLGIAPEPEEEYSVLRYFDLQLRYKGSRQHKADRKYWLHRFTHIKRYSFPAGYRSLRGQNATEYLTVDHATYSKLQRLARKSSCTLHFLLMTLAAATTYIISGKQNFCIFSLTHGRINQKLKNTIGCMMNAIPMLYELEPDTPVDDMLPACYTSFLEALSHGRLPFGELLVMSYIESIKHFFNFNHGWLVFSCMEYGGLFASSKYDMRLLSNHNQPHQFYLSMLEIPGERVEFELLYQTHKYSAQTATELLAAYSFVIGCAVDNPHYTLEQLKDAYEREMPQ